MSITGWFKLHKMKRSLANDEALIVDNGLTYKWSQSMIDSVDRQLSPEIRDLSSGKSWDSWHPRNGDIGKVVLTTSNYSTKIFLLKIGENYALVGLDGLFLHMCMERPKRALTTSEILNRGRKKHLLTACIVNTLSGAFLAVIVMLFGTVTLAMMFGWSADLTKYEISKVLAWPPSVPVSIVIVCATCLSGLFAGLPVLLNPYIPISVPPRKYIRRIVLASISAPVIASLGYTYLGWFGFTIGCTIPFAIFPWTLRYFFPWPLHKSQVWEGLEDLKKEQWRKRRL